MNKEESLVFLKELINRIDNQDNRVTAQPLQFLFQIKRTMVVDGDYNYDEIHYYHPILERSYPSYEKCLTVLKENGYDEKEQEDIRKLYIKHYWETSQAFLTEEGVKDHIRLNKHNLREYRDYVVHAFRNPEFKNLIDAVRVLIHE